jgi:putative membrane protein
MTSKTSELFRHFWMGLIIGICDLVPGVSGGTMAFAFGIWEDVLDSITKAIHTARYGLFLDFRSAGKSFRSIKWRLIIPLGVGVLGSLLVGSSIISDLLLRYEPLTLSFFLGIVIGALPVPLRMAKHWKLQHFLLCLFGLVVTSLLAGLPTREIDSSPAILIVLVAAVSIAATLLPGLSGSFLLLVFGYYHLFIRALAERDIAVWIYFAIGAWVGVVLLSSGIRWLLSRFRLPVLALLVGFMLGGLRVLWPWLGPERQILSPNQDELLACVSCLVLGVGLSVFGWRFSKQSETSL